MRILKELREIRITEKAETFNNGFRIINAKCMYISKYESTIQVKKETENAVLFSFSSNCSTFINRERIFREPSQTNTELWVPKVCIKGDIKSESFEITDSFIKKKDVLTRLVPFPERGYRHKNEYRVMDLQKFEKWLSSDKEAH